MAEHLSNQERAAMDALASSATVAGGPPSPCLPRELTPPMREALSLMLWTTGPTAHAYRIAGHDIPRRAEDEQAFVLHRCLLAAIEHGDAWREVIAREIEGLVAAPTPVTPAPGDLG